MFAVFKDLLRDQFVMDARPPNAAEETLTGRTSLIAAACCLTTLIIPHDMICAVSSDDLVDYYYQFLVSEARARRNVFCWALGF